MITSIDKTTAITLRDEMNAALELVAQRHGISIRAGSCTFNPLNATFKVTVAVKTNGVVETPERTSFKNCAYRFGLSADDLGKSFSYASNTYTVCGLKLKSYKRPILASRNGRTFKFTAEAVKAALAVSNPVTR